MKLPFSQLSHMLRELPQKLSPQRIGRFIKSACLRAVQVCVPDKYLPTSLKPGYQKTWTDYDISGAKGISLITTPGDNIQSYFNHILKAVEETEVSIQCGDDVEPHPDSLKQCHPDELHRIFKEDASQGGLLLLHLLQKDPQAMEEVWENCTADQLADMLGDYCQLLDSLSINQAFALLSHDARSGGHLFVVLTQTHPVILGRFLKDLSTEELRSLMLAYNKATSSKTPEQGRAILRMLHTHFPEGVASKREEGMNHFDFMQMAIQFCGWNLQPETLAAMLQEKYELSDLSMGELASLPPTTIMTDMAFRLEKARSESVSLQWYERWLSKKDELLADMPASALLGPGEPEYHNAYAISFAALIEAAIESHDGDLMMATKVLDQLLCVGLPVHNLKNEANDKVISVGDGDLYRELKNISIGDVAVLVGEDNDASEQLLKKLGWKPLQRSGDETRKELIAREFLGEFFSGYLPK